MSTIEEIAEREFSNLLPTYAEIQAKLLSKEVDQYESILQIYRTYDQLEKNLKEQYEENRQMLAENCERAIREFEARHPNAKAEFWQGKG